MGRISAILETGPILKKGLIQVVTAIAVFIFFLSVFLIHC